MSGPKEKFLNIDLVAKSLAGGAAGGRDVKTHLGVVPGCLNGRKLIFMFNV